MKIYLEFILILIFVKKIILILFLKINICKDIIDMFGDFFLFKIIDYFFKKNFRK